MKYALISLFLLLAVSSCGSRKTVVHSESTFDRTESRESVTQAKDSTSQISESQVTKQVDTHINEYERTVKFDSTGRVSEVQERWRDTGSLELGTSHSRQHDVSVTETKDSTRAEVNTAATQTIDSETETDNRFVQVFKWFWILIPIGIVVFMLKLRK